MTQIGEIARVKRALTGAGITPLPYFIGHTLRWTTVIRDMSVLSAQYAEFALTARTAVRIPIDPVLQRTPTIRAGIEHLDRDCIVKRSIWQETVLIVSLVFHAEHVHAKKRMGQPLVRASPPLPDFPVGAAMTVDIAPTFKAARVHGQVTCDLCMRHYTSAAAPEDPTLGPTNQASRPPPHETSLPCKILSISSVGCARFLRLSHPAEPIVARCLGRNAHFSGPELLRRFQHVREQVGECPDHGIRTVRAV